MRSKVGGSWGRTVVVFAWVICGALCFADGDLDPTFSGDGLVTLEIGSFEAAAFLLVANGWKDHRGWYGKQWQQQRLPVGSLSGRRHAGPGFWYWWHCHDAHWNRQ